MTKDRYVGGDEEAILGYNSWLVAVGLLQEAGIFTFGDLRALLNSSCAHKLRLAAAENELTSAQAKVNQLRSRMKEV